MTPSINQLKSVIARGDNSKDYILILDLKGEFKLLLQEEFQIDNLKYLSKYDSLDSWTDSVGSNASKDEAELRNIMIWADKIWNQYLIDKKYPVVNFES